MSTARRADGATFESVVTQAIDALVIVDPAGVISYASPALGRALGTEHELTNTNVADLVYADDAPATLAAIWTPG